jgi:NAD(P)-dependent dehydrogenase (short-subunit alcohol dehydrogenase family)
MNELRAGKRADGRRRLNDQLALVTGGGSGIGEATAKLFAREGARVAVADIDYEAAQRVAEEIRAAGGEANAHALDVRYEASWKATLEGVSKRFGRLRVLVNNAGISLAGDVVETSFEEWRRVHSVNLDGVFLGTREAIRMMRGHSGGVVVNVASQSGIDAYPGAGAYAASKAGVIQLSKVAAKECELAGSDVRVHFIAPGGVKTPLWKTMPFWTELAADGEEAAWAKLDPAGVFETAERVAESILELVLPSSSG